MTHIRSVYECALQRAARIGTVLTEVNGWITGRLGEITFPRERNISENRKESVCFIYTISLATCHLSQLFPRSEQTRALLDRVYKLTVAKVTCRVDSLVPIPYIRIKLVKYLCSIEQILATI